MRVATSTFYDSTRYAIQLAQSKLIRAQTEISSNSKLQTAADNPTDAVQVLRIGQLLSENTQYRNASGIAKNRLELSETALSRMNDLVTRARELAVQLGNGSLSTGARQGIGAEASSLLQSMVGANDLRFGRLSERELRAYLGQLRDAKPPACLTIIGLAKLARGRYAQAVPHFYAAHALLSVLADSDEARGLETQQVVEVMKQLCALPDAELRARAAAAAETLYGAKLKSARRE
jgi:hypothetical protein